jgi:hypothetical protein
MPFSISRGEPENYTEDNNGNDDADDRMGYCYGIPVDSWKEPLQTIQLFIRQDANKKLRGREGKLTVIAVMCNNETKVATAQIFHWDPVPRVASK